MAQTNFSGPVQSAAGFKVGDTEVIDSNGNVVGGITAPAGSIGTSELADGAVTSAKIADVANTVPVVIKLAQAFAAPAGSNDLDNDIAFFTVPTGVYATIEAVAAFVRSNTSTSGSDATNQYTFELYNQTDAESLSSATVGTDGAELQAGNPKALTVDQNTTLQAGDTLALRYDILDDGGSGPTDLSSAEIEVILYFRPLT